MINLVEHVNSKDQRTDIFIKALAHLKHGEIRSMLGVMDQFKGENVIIN